MSEIKGKKILIAGFGMEGQSTLSYLQKNYSDLEIAVADKNAEVLKDLKDLKTYSGENYLDDVASFDTVVRSPGIPLDSFKNAKHITSLTNIFFAICKGRVVAITGTKGKSTTTTLIYELLKTKFRDVRLIGNIGSPALDALEGANENTVFVFEISSFQLEDIHYSPHIAVVLAVTEDHIDRHGSLEEYVLAKQNIMRFQSQNDFVFFNAVDSNAVKIAHSSKAQKIAVYPKKVDFETSLIGEGNEINIQMAMAVAKHFEVAEEEIRNIISNFKPLPHRIEKVGTFKGITFYDDSIATNPSASLNGIRAIDNLETVIIGGANKGFDYADYVKEVSDLNIKNIILMPDTGVEMKGHFENLAKNSKILVGNTMETAVKLAYENTSPVGAVLLSPAATSFNMFRDYKERGDVFKKFVEELGK